MKTEQILTKKDEYSISSLSGECSNITSYLEVFNVDEKGLAGDILSFCVKNDATITPESVIFKQKEKTITWNKAKFILACIDAQKMGLKIRDGEVYIVDFKGIPTIHPNYNAEIRLYKEQGVTFSFFKLFEGDTFKFAGNQWKCSLNLVQHGEEIIGKTPKYYCVEMAINGKFFANKVMSPSEILAGANPSGRFMYEGAFKDQMYQKYIVRQLIAHAKRCNAISLQADFDRLENYSQYVEIDNAPIEIKEKNILKEEALKKALTAIKEGTVKNIASIDKKYNVEGDTRQELVNAFKEKEAEENNDKQISENINSEPDIEIPELFK
jgi:hypothetical protein